MKKFIIGLAVIVVLLIISSYIEISYCHYWTTQPPIGAPDDYIKNTKLCKINSTPAMIGILGILPIKDVVDWIR